MERKTIIVAGAGGHAAEVLDVLAEMQTASIYLFDEINLEIKSKYGYDMVHSTGQIRDSFHDFKFVLGVGDPLLRRQFYDRLSAIGGVLLSLRPSSASISSACFSLSFDCMKNVFVGPNSFIGSGVLLNTGSQIHHDAQIGDFSEISPRSVILGGAKIGSYCRIGANATILPNVTVGDKSIIGAGSVVSKNLPANCLAMGVPAFVKRIFA